MFSRLLFYITVCLPAVLGCYNHTNLNLDPSLFIFKNNVYNLTNFNHPGGPRYVEMLRGRNASDFWDLKKYQFHQGRDKEEVDVLLKTMFVAPICESNTTSYLLSAPEIICGVKDAVMNPSKDHISLHYDMSYDPDDYLSAVADRSILETLYGNQFLYQNTTRVIGTCGGKCSGYNKPADKLMDYTYKDVGGWKNSLTDSKNALIYELEFFKDTIERGGRVWIKEGGESDFTKKVVTELEKWKKGSGKCVYVIQHSSTNEKNAGAGVLAYVKANTMYSKISDGNPPYQKKNWKMNGKSFDYYGLQSRWSCAWKYAFDEFKKKKSYCAGKPQPVQKCVDFSDTHELLYITGDDRSKPIGMNSYVSTYLKSSLDKLVC